MSDFPNSDNSEDADPEDQKEAFESNGTILFDGQFEVDEEELDESFEERGIISDVSDDLKILAKENHLRLLLTDVVNTSTSPDHSLCTTTLRLASMPDPACVFLWASLLIDLDVSPSAKFVRIAPTTEELSKISVSRTVEPSVKVAIPKAPLDITLGAKKEINYEVMRPQLTGVNFENKAMWTFRALTEECDLRFNHELILETQYPSALDMPLRASLRVKARVAFRGFAGAIPLVGRAQANHGAIVYLDRLDQ